MTYLPDRDFLVEVALGRVPKHRIESNFGRNENVPTGSFAFVNRLSHTMSAR